METANPTSFSIPVETLDAMDVFRLSLRRKTGVYISRSALLRALVAGAFTAKTEPYLIDARNEDDIAAKIGLALVAAAKPARRSRKEAA